MCYKEILPLALYLKGQFSYKFLRNSTFFGVNTLVQNQFASSRQFGAKTIANHIKGKLFT